MDIKKYTDEFFAMEKSLDLFSRRIDGIPWWDPVRYEVYCFVYHRLSSATLVQPASVSLFRRGMRWIERRLMAAWLRIKLVFRSYDFFVLRAPRHIDSNGVRVDVILDDILASTPGSKLVIDTFPNYYHVSKRGCFLAYSELSSINSEVHIRFGMCLDVESLISLIFTQYRESFYQYRKWLIRAKPKCVILVQNGIEKALFSAASELSIPVVEAQHGLINYSHPAYSYPPEITPGTLSTFPTVFLTFSQYWTDNCHYPVPQSIVVGNRRLSLAPNHTGSDDILVISADIYELAIEELLRPAAAALPQRRFVYKLHPNQFAWRSEIEKRLSDIPNIEIVGNENTLQQLAERCIGALCIQSTGVYEMLQAGLSVYLLAKQDYQIHADVFDYPNVYVVHDHEEFVRVVSVPRESAISGPLPIFFQEFDSAATTAIMKELCA